MPSRRERSSWNLGTLFPTINRGFIFKCFLVGLAFGCCPGAEVWADAPVLVSLIARRGTQVLSVAGELLEETPQHVKVLNFRNYEAETFSRESIYQLKNPATEQDVASTSGIGRTIAWQIAHALPPRPGEGKIVSVDAAVAYLDLGREAGIRLGNRLNVLRGEETLIDPQSEEVIGVKQRKIAEVEVIDVQARTSKVRLISDFDTKLVMGDRVSPADLGDPIAVLPFGNEAGHLVEGGLQLADEIVADLSRQGVPVTDRTLLSHTLQELERRPDAEFGRNITNTLGRLLRVQTLATGNVNMGDRLGTISIRLIDVASGKILYSTTLKTGTIDTTLIPDAGRRPLTFPSPANMGPPVPSTPAAAGSQPGEPVRIWKSSLGNYKCAAFSPDGQTIATANNDNSVQLLSVATGDLRQVLKGHTKYVRSVDFSADGNYLASGSVDNSVRLWSARTGELLHLLNGHKNYVKSVDFSPDSQQLASGSWDQTIHLYSVPDGQLLKELKSTGGLVESVAFGPDGKLLADGNWGRTIELWSIPSGRLAGTLQGHTDDILDVTISPDGAYLASASKDQTARIWSISEKSLLRTLQGHASKVLTVAFHPQSPYLASGGEDGKLLFWSVPDGRLLRTLQPHTEPISFITFSPDGQSLLTGSADKTMKLWPVPKF